MDALVLCRSDAGDGGWSLHAPGSTDEQIADGTAPYLASGDASILPNNGEWSRPDGNDYAAAEAAYAARQTTHTPGPWTAVLYRGTWAIRFDGPDHRWHVADVYGQADSNEPPMTRHGHAEGNARLIAAAPDLYAALDALLAWGREHTSPRDADSPHELLIAAAKAITKATP